MSQPYIGEIRIFAGNFAPNGWQFCLGQLLPISENETLFQLIGTTYGGDGQETFALPNLASRIPIHQGSGYPLGNIGGVEQVQLLPNQIPAHTHVPAASVSTADLGLSPAGNVWAGTQRSVYSNAAPATAMNVAALDGAGGNQPHDNMAPFLAVNFIISLFGVFPSST